MFWLVTDLLRHTAPMELEKPTERRVFYKHFAFKKLLFQVIDAETRACSQGR